MNRRTVLLSTAGLPALLAAPAASKDRMAKLEVFVIKVNHRGNWILPRITTDSGVTGIGDASQGGNEKNVLDMIGRIFKMAQQVSITDVEKLRHGAEPLVEENGRSAAVALSGIEQCMWDIRGKIDGIPVYQYFGGALRTRLRNYANINRSVTDRTPEGFAAMAKRAIAAGFDAIKMAPWDNTPKTSEAMMKGIACGEAVREVIGPKRDLLMDVHSHFNPEHALELAHRVEHLNLFWLEEATPANPPSALAMIRKQSKMPTAGGESLYGVKGFYPYIHAGAVDIVMPDIKYSGGLFEVKKVAAMAEGAGLTVAPHGPASPIGNVAAAHVCATMPNFKILEYSFGEVPWRAEIVNPPEKLVNGVLSLTNAPGLGVTLNEQAVAKYKA